MTSWALLVLTLLALARATKNIPALSPDQLQQQQEEEEEEEDDGPYDPNDEPPIFLCRRDPTWKSVDYEECQELTQWFADDVWTVMDHGNTQNWLGDKEKLLEECLDSAFAEAKQKYNWAKCDEANRTEICKVDNPRVMGHYFRDGQGHLMTIENALTEQEAFGVETLSDCMRNILPQQVPFYEEREFGQDTDQAYGMYNNKGGNYCTFLQGLMQKYLPGVVASIYKAVEAAYYDADWGKFGFPPPEEMGVRTAEYLHYKRSGKLGAHQDSGSVFSISVALSNMEDYTGGFFQLQTPDALFKVPRRSAIVFFSESDHSITEITGGERKVFVVELWEEQDTPVGIPRPSHDQFEEHKEKRRNLLPQEEAGSGSDEL